MISPLPPRTEDPRITVHLLGLYPFNTKFISFPFNLLAYRQRIRKLLRRIKPDILHAHFVTDCGFWAALSGFHPLVMSAWGSDILVLPRKSRLLRFMVRFALKRADLITTSTDSMCDYLKSNFAIPPDRVEWISWGPDLEIFKKDYLEECRALKKSLDLADGAPTVISPRNMARLYRIETIVKSLPFVLEKMPQVVFLLLEGNGDPAYKQELQDLVRAQHLDQNVRFVSRFLSPKEMAVHYNISNVLVSIPESDQLGVTILEGMSCGNAVILSNLEVYRQLFREGENVLFLQPDGPQDLAQKIISCFAHPELNESMFNTNKIMIEEHWNWRKNALVMEKAYNRLIKKD